MDYSTFMNDFADNYADNKIEKITKYIEDRNEILYMLDSGSSLVVNRVIQNLKNLGYEVSIEDTYIKHTSLKINRK